MKTRVLIAVLAVPCAAFGQVPINGYQPIDLVPLTMEVSRIRQQIEIQGQIRAIDERNAAEREDRLHAEEDYANWYLERQRIEQQAQQAARDREAALIAFQTAFFAKERALAAERAKLPPDPSKVAREEGARKSWASVKSGMTKSEVMNLLGGPNIIAGNRWIFNGLGSVVFEGEKVAAVK